MRIKFFIATMLLAVLAVGVSSFTVKDFNKRAFVEKCFTINGDGYSQTDAILTDCPSGPVLCGFCVDSDDLSAGQPKWYVEEAIADLGAGATHGTNIPVAAGTYFQGTTPNPAFDITFYKKAQ